MTNYIWTIILEIFIQKIEIKIRKIMSSKIICMVGYFCRDVLYFCINITSVYSYIICQFFLNMYNLFFFLD